MAGSTGSGAPPDSPGHGPRRRFALRKRKGPLRPSSFLENIGPQSVEELWDWDKALGSRMQGAGLGNPAMDLLQHGLWTYSDFAGADFNNESLRIGIPGLAAAVGRPVPDVRHIRSSDWEEVQLFVFKKAAKMAGGSSCVFKDLSLRADKDVQEWMNGLCPKPGTVAAKTIPPSVESNQEIRGMLDLNRSWIFSKKQTCDCVVHNRPCPAYPGSIFDVPLDEFADMEQGAQEVPSKRLRESDAMDAGRARRPWWAAENFVDRNKPRPLLVNIAGITCLDYTSLGKQKRGGGSHDRYHSTWCAERQQLAEWNLEDVFISECSERYPAQEEQVMPLEKTHHVAWIRTGPMQQGIPVRRVRTLTAGCNLLSTVWTGPDDPEEVQREFDQLFARTLELTGSALFVAGEEEVHDWVLKRALKRQVQLPPNFKKLPMVDYLHKLVSRSTTQRKTVYDHLRESKGGLCGEFVCDLEQNAKFAQPGQVAPTFNTHSEMFCYDAQRIAVKSDYMAMQGVDATPFLNPRRGRSPLMSIIDVLPELDVRALVGNGLHVVVFACWFMYVCSKVRRREIPNDSAGVAASIGRPRSLRRR